MSASTRMLSTPSPPASPAKGKIEKNRAAHLADNQNEIAERERQPSRQQRRPMKIRSMPQPHHVTAIDATFALAKLAGLELEVISTLLPRSMNTVLATARGNLLLVPATIEGGNDRETIDELVALTRTDAVIVRPALRGVSLDVVSYGRPRRWNTGCRPWMQGADSQPFLIGEGGDGPTFGMSLTGLISLSTPPWLDREDFTDGITRASASLRDLMEAR